ncbi:transposase domain containing protein [Trichonephila clavipes]|nr:transposase domain containing protein [Trichonephila clavipes]
MPIQLSPLSFDYGSNYEIIRAKVLNCKITPVVAVERIGTWFLDTPYTLKNQSIMTTPTFCNELVWRTWKVHDQVEVVFNCCWRVGRIIPSLTPVCNGKGCGSNAKWMTDGETRSRRHGVGHPYTIKEKGCWKLSCMRTLLDMGLRSKRPTSVPLLTKRHRQLHLHWARKHRDRSMDKWERVAWSDESRFVIHHVNGRVRIRCLPGGQFLPQCTVDHTQASGKGIRL